MGTLNLERVVPRRKHRPSHTQHARALRLDRASILQGGLALVLACVVAWLFNLR